MDLAELYHFLFETMPGIGVLVGACLILSLLVCIFWERRTRKMFRDRPVEDDEWAIDDEPEEES